jgi:putative methyltransferase (TIGR04325 family)
MTAGPAPRVAALLALFRPVCDEIVVALDERADAHVEAALVAQSDVLIRYPYAEPVDRPLAWLHRQCSGAWVFTIDDDEIPEASLLTVLPKLPQAADVTHYWLRRRWLYPDRARYLDEPPWRPDYQLRLVRNEQPLLRFPDETHVPIAVLGPGRYLELAVYHADCILNSPERRVEKARKYERMRPGKRVTGGFLNEAFYLPERRPSARTAAVPVHDHELVERVLGATDVAGTSQRAASIRHASREEIDRPWSGRVFAETAYRARLELLEPPYEMEVGEQRTFDVRVENLGSETWDWGEDGRPEVRLAYHWRRENGDVVIWDGLRTPFPAPVPSGGTALVPVHVVAPPEHGAYRLALDLLHEHVRWFGCELGVGIDVRPTRVAPAAPTEPPPIPLPVRLRLLAKALLPPLLWQALKRLKDRLRGPGQAPEVTGAAELVGQAAAPEWEYVPEGWARRQTDPNVKGWDVDAVVDAYRRRWPVFVEALRSTGPLAVHHELAEPGARDIDAHNMLVSFAYVLALAARGRSRLSLLDWGGGIGHYYLVAKEVVPGLELEYHCRDVPKLCAYGRELFPEASFYEDESCLARRFDLVLASGSLQYSEDWRGTLARLAGATDRYLYVTRLPVAFASASFVVLQRAYAYGYDTEYLGWVVNRDELLAAAEAADLTLVREFLLAARFSAPAAPEDPVEHRGFLFEPTFLRGAADRA